MNIKMPSLKIDKTKSLKTGSYNFIIVVIVLAIAVVINLLAAALPGSVTQLDISASKLYSITSNTKVIVNPIEKDVNIYWIVQAGEENSVIEKLLSKYESLNSHISVVKKNPDIYPTFAEQYTDDDVNNNDLIVECGEKYRYISVSDIYEYDEASYYSGSYDVYFDGEGEITSAISYVASDDFPKVYLLTGHGESELTDSFSDALAKANYELEDLSLLTTDEFPEDADCLIINAPTSDISEAEKDMLIDYITDGGRVFVLSGPAEQDAYVNLEAVLENYGMEFAEGIVLETDRSNYAFSMPYALIPEIEESDITSPLIEEDKYIIMPIAQGITQTEYYRSTLTVTPLLMSGDGSFAKSEGYYLTDYDMDADDTYGPFILGVAIEDTKENSDGGRLVWISSSYFLEDIYNSYSSGANVDTAMNSISWLADQDDAISIRSKSLNNEYLTISDSEATQLKIIIIGVVPAFFVVFGLVEVLKRRKLA